MKYPLTGDFLAGRLRQHLSEDDLSLIESAIESTEEHDDDTRLLERGQLVDRSCLLIEGYIFRVVENGGQRFIVGVHVPGDFVDLHGFALKRLDHSIVTAGKTRIGLVSHDTLTRIGNERFRVARAMWFATLLDAAIHRKWIQVLEQLDAPRRMAHLYCELQRRLELIGKANPRVVRTPFTQLDLADMCGISAIHANRAVAKLRELEVAEIRRGDFYASDWDTVRHYAMFDDSYLYGEGPLALKEGW